MGVCPQHNILFDKLTVEEHLELFCALKGTKQEEIPSLVKKMIEDVDLKEKAKYESMNLSGG